MEQFSPLDIVVSKHGNETVRIGCGCWGPLLIILLILLVKVLS